MRCRRRRVRTFAPNVRSIAMAPIIRRIATYLQVFTGFPQSIDYRIRLYSRNCVLNCPTPPRSFTLSIIVNMDTTTHISVAPHAPQVQGVERVLTPEATAFIADLAVRFAPRLRTLLAQRVERQARLDAGERLDFLKETAGVRESDWRIAPTPPALQDRRVEITGPVDRKMVINGLNS